MPQNFTLSVISSTVAERKSNMTKLFYVSLVVLVCVISVIKSERTYSGTCKGCQPEYIRIKRAKYYSSPPFRFYNKLPMTYPVKGAFPFTPPAGYIMDDVRQPLSLKPKVFSGRPIDEGLGDDYVNNIMKFLSKEELDKIVEFANEKDRELSRKPNYIPNDGENYESKMMYNDYASELIRDNKFPNHQPFLSAQQDFKPYIFNYNDPDINELKETRPFRVSELESTAPFINKNQMRLNTLYSDRVMQNQLFSNIHENKNDTNIFTDSSVMQEELLPKPSNLRDEDFEVSYTNNVPTIVKANSNSYKIENLGSLPLMNYHSKLESVDSYRVPHYTVTTAEKYRASSSSPNIPVEPAPPVSTAHEQSDAHLKATKIWTHKSRGTAYTLHDDGTLSLEKPIPPKSLFGSPY